MRVSPERLPTSDLQAGWAAQLVPLLMAKQPIVGVYWTHYHDASPHRYPFGGLVDAEGNPKPARDVFVRSHRHFWSNE